MVYHLYWFFLWGETQAFFCPVRVRCQESGSHAGAMPPNGALQRTLDPVAVPAAVYTTPASSAAELC